MASFIGLFWYQQLLEPTSQKKMNLWIHFKKFLKIPFILPLLLGGKNDSLCPLSCKKCSTNRTNPGSCLIYSASSILLLRKFYILYSYWTRGPFWKICILAIKPFCKQQHRFQWLDEWAGCRLTLKITCHTCVWGAQWLFTPSAIWLYRYNNNYSIEVCSSLNHINIQWFH